MKGTNLWANTSKPQKAQRKAICDAKKNGHSLKMNLAKHHKLIWSGTLRASSLHELIPLLVWFLESYNSSTDDDPSQSNLCYNDVIMPPASTLGCRWNHLGGWVRRRQENQHCCVFEVIRNWFPMDPKSMVKAVYEENLLNPGVACVICSSKFMSIPFISL